jgi:hypothetical protein
LTVLVVGFAYIHRGLRRRIGVLIVAAYVVFAATLTVTARQSPVSLATYVLPALVVVALSSALLIWPRPDGKSGAR